MEGEEERGDQWKRQRRGVGGGTGVRRVVPYRSPRSESEESEEADNQRDQRINLRRSKDSESRGPEDSESADSEDSVGGFRVSGFRGFKAKGGFRGIRVRGGEDEGGIPRDHAAIEPERETERERLLDKDSRGPLQQDHHHPLSRHSVTHFHEFLRGFSQLPPFTYKCMRARHISFGTHGCLTYSGWRCLSSNVLCSCQPQQQRLFCLRAPSTFTFQACMPSRGVGWSVLCSWWMVGALFVPVVPVVPVFLLFLLFLLFLFLLFLFLLLLFLFLFLLLLFLFLFLLLLLFLLLQQNQTAPVPSSGLQPHDPACGRTVLHFVRSSYKALQQQ